MRAFSMGDRPQRQEAMRSPNLDNAQAALGIVGYNASLRAPMTARAVSLRSYVPIEVRIQPTLLPDQIKRSGSPSAAPVALGDWGKSYHYIIHKRYRGVPAWAAAGVPRYNAGKRGNRDAFRQPQKSVRVIALDKALQETMRQILATRGSTYPG